MNSTFLQKKLRFPIVFITCLLSLGFCQLTFAGPDGWSYRRPVTITEQSGTALSNYQTLITLNTNALITAGKLRSDGSDLRFSANSDGSSPLKYWIESGLNTTSTKIWIRMPALAASASVTIYMFYDNPDATTGSDVSVFDGPFRSLSTLTAGSKAGTGGQYGWQFVTTEALLVTAFGKNSADGVEGYVTVFDFASKAKLYQHLVKEGTGWIYDPISNPFWLQANTNYVVLQNVTAGNKYFFTSPTSQGGAHLQYVASAACNGCSKDAFPGNNYPGWHYGYADIEYRLRKHASAEPTFTTGTEELIQVKLLSSDSDRHICKGEPVTLTGPAGYTNYEFFRNDTSIQNGPQQTYQVTNIVDGSVFRLTVTETGGGKMNSNTVKINVHAKPLPDFSATEVCLEWETAFTDLSSGTDTGTYRKWDFGDGEISEEQNPNHLYLNPGSYKVKLIVINGGDCGDSIVKNIEVKPFPQPAFGFSVSGLTVNFSDLSSGVQNYYWDFGDASFSTLSNPVHTYAAPGTYNTCLFGGNDCDTSSYCQDIVLSGTGINHLNATTAIYPNPSEGIFTIALPQHQPLLQVQVFNTQGKEVTYHVSYRGETVVLDLSEESAGVYFCLLRTPGYTLHQKILISRDR